MAAGHKVHRGAHLFGLLATKGDFIGVHLGFLISLTILGKSTRAKSKLNYTNNFIFPKLTVSEV